MVNFEIRVGGKPGDHYAQRPCGALLATISPRIEQSGKTSGRFLNVCYLDGKVDIADGLEHASELIASKCPTLARA